MKNLKRIVIFMLIVMLCVAFSSLSAFATGEVDPNGNQGEVVSNVPDDGGNSAGDTDLQSNPVEEPDPVTSSVVENPIDNNQQNYQDNNYNNYNNNYDNYYNENSVDNNGYYYYDEDSMASQLTGDDQKAGNVSDKTNLYDTSDINDSELKSNEWNEIVLSEKEAVSGVDDFSSIKDNKSKNDNGGWILYTGIILIVLSILGIIYFIAATYKSKKLSKLPPGRRPSQSSRQPGYNPERNSRNPEGRRQPQSYSRASQRERHRYNDGYDNYSKKSSKADTQEIYIPRRYAKK